MDNRSVLAHIPHSSLLLAPPPVIACERQHSTFFTTLPGMSSRTPSFIFILNFCSCLRFQTQHIMACERQHSTFFLKRKSNSQWDEQLNTEPSHTQLYLTALVSASTYNTTWHTCEKTFLQILNNSPWDEHLHPVASC